MKMVLKSLLTYTKKHLNRHAPNKQKYGRGNNLPFMSKTLITNP